MFFPRWGLAAAEAISFVVRRQRCRTSELWSRREEGRYSPLLVIQVMRVIMRMVLFFV